MKLYILLACLITLPVYAANIDRTGLYSKESLAKNLRDDAETLLYRYNALQTITLPKEGPIRAPQMMRLSSILAAWTVFDINLAEAQKRINDNYRTTGLANDPQTPDHPDTAPNKAVSAPAGMATTAATAPAEFPYSSAQFWHKHVTTRIPAKFFTVNDAIIEWAAKKAQSIKALQNLAKEKTTPVSVPTSTGGSIQLTKLNVGSTD